MRTHAIRAANVIFMRAHVQFACPNIEQTIYMEMLCMACARACSCPPRLNSLTDRYPAIEESLISGIIFNCYSIKSFRFVEHCHTFTAASHSERQTCKTTPTCMQQLTFEAQYLGTISFVTATLLGNTFGWTFSKQQMMVAQLSEEVFALELLLQELFIEIPEPYLRWRVIQYIECVPVCSYAPA